MADEPPVPPAAAAASAASSFLDQSEIDKLLAQSTAAPVTNSLLIHANDDRVVNVHNSEVMAQALAKAGVEHELHLFAHGGHGFGMRMPPDSTLAVWPLLAQRWLQATEAAH